MVPPTVRYSVLGPIRAWRHDTEVDLGSRPQRLLVGLLLAHAGRPVAVPGLVELLWADNPPPTARREVGQHLSGLRRILSPGPQAATWRLPVDEASLDLLAFRRLAGQARQSVVRGKAAGAVPQFVEALQLWRGRCGAGLEPTSALHPAFVAVTREGSQVAKEAADAALSCGAPHTVLEVLRHATDRDSADEALAARLIRVMAADGRRTEAAALYEELHHRYVDVLGVEPGPELHDAYAALRRRPVAPPPSDRPSAPPSDRPATASRPAQLPAASQLFTGRQDELRTLAGWLPADPRRAPVVTVAIDGIPGIGKSTLAVQWAHSVASSFPDGQLVVNLRGFDARAAVIDVDEALTGFLTAIGVSHRGVPAGVEAKAALYRTMMAGRRMLILVDNARDAEQVRPFIPGSPGCLVIATSRKRLTGLAAQNGAHLLTLDVPSLEDARETLRLRLGDGRVATDPTALDEIIQECGRLPLAMAVVGARAATHPADPLRDIAAELHAGRGTLDAFSGDEPAWDLRTVCSWSYRLLSADAARLFRLLSLHPGPDFSLPIMASLVGLDQRETARLVGELTHTRLLSEHRSRRYVLHDLIGVYAMELADATDSADDQRAAVSRLIDHLRLTAHAANDIFMPSMARFAAEPTTSAPRRLQSVSQPR